MPSITHLAWDSRNLTLYIFIYQLTRSQWYLTQWASINLVSNLCLREEVCFCLASPKQRLTLFSFSLSTHNMLFRSITSYFWPYNTIKLDYYQQLYSYINMECYELLIIVSCSESQCVCLSEPIDRCTVGKYPHSHTVYVGKHPKTQPWLPSGPRGTMIICVDLGV